MTDEHEEELSEDESRTLRLLREGPHPPPGLEGRVISALRERGMLHDDQGVSRRWWWVSVSVAASLIPSDRSGDPLLDSPRRSRYMKSTPAESP